ncbi:MAG: hypothetical protein COA71_14520 [SAR86 cluster bacterium]|uniref:Uncharacterized protein n=1 Tax=SAR86 cluster bacterium TaxID=2030880 RepID=A0A2A5C5Q2_9GAMM|nr:MAG: hypothetical protein COA71_14520 [SAR86 cluster bacterium]
MEIVLFVIKVGPYYEDVIKDLYMTGPDLMNYLEKHAKQYLKEDPNFCYIAPSKYIADYSDVLGGQGHFIWYSDREEYLKVMKTFELKSPHIYQAFVYSDPPELKNTFDYEAIGLQSNVSEDNKDGFLVLNFKEN